MKTTTTIFLVRCFTVTLSLQATTEAPPTRRVTVPPLIVEEAPVEMAFRVGESVEIPCVASGHPAPLYKWTMNDHDFDPSGTDGRIVTTPGVGTLLFANATERDDGLYQCFASNEFGTAVAVRVNFRQAYLHSFPSSAVDYHRPQLGYPQTLRCTPPHSYPKPQIFWATIITGERFTPVDLTDRITIDPEGNLHFAHIRREDGQDGRRYACLVENDVVRSLEQGDYAIIQPQGQFIQNTAPEIMWSSPTHQLALRGDTWRVKCIFSGSPTPRVVWHKPGGNMSTNARTESFGQELVVENIQYEDGGQYECRGVNDEAQTPITRSFDLELEARPYWTQGPQSVNTTEGDTAEIHCEPAGIPDPMNYWFIDGVSIAHVPGNPDRIVENTKITFLNIVKHDVQVIQCRATNTHGYIFANAYLNVIPEAPYPGSGATTISVAALLLVVIARYLF